MSVVGYTVLFFLFVFVFGVYNEVVTLSRSASRSGLAFIGAKEQWENLLDMGVSYVFACGAVYSIVKLIPSLEAMRGQVHPASSVTGVDKQVGDKIKGGDAFG